MLAKAGSLTVIFQGKKYATNSGFILGDSHFGNDRKTTALDRPARACERFLHLTLRRRRARVSIRPPSAMSDLERGLRLISRAATHCRIAIGRGVDRIATSNDLSGECDDEVAGPSGRFVDGVVGAEELGTTGDHRIANAGVVGARFLGVGVRAGTNEIALANKRCNIGGRTFVALDEGSIRLARLRVGEDDASSQRGMASEVDRADGALVHQKDDLAACASETRPVAG